MRCSLLLATVALPLFAAGSSLRAFITCGGSYGPCATGTYCRAGACSVLDGRGDNCLGICVPGYAEGENYNDPSNYPVGGGFQLTDSAASAYQPQNQQQGQPAYVQQQGASAPAPPGGTGPGFSCVNGYNSQCAQGTVCMADPRNLGITPVAICVPATRLCGGQTDAKCKSGLVCVADPRINCNPLRGDRGCTGICV